ncbi:MAG: polyprenyl synthetase family protein [Spirochaetota bacterium]
MPSSIQLKVLIKRFDSKLDTIISEDLKILKEIKKYVIRSGGKRIRPLTHYFFSQILNYSGKYWLDIGAIAELIHAASLLHDDVVDNAETRRGKATIGKLYGNKSAILAGDFLLACGIEHLNRLSNSSLMSSFTKVIRDLSVAELLQMQWEKNPKISRVEYEKIIYGKTASLFGATCETAGILADESSKSIKALRNFGNSMGRLFQIRDDYIDYFSSNDKSGKEQYKDFHNGLFTYPIIVLREHMTAKETKNIHAVFKQESRDQLEIDFINESFHKYEIQQYIQSEIKDEIKKLLTYLQKFESSDARDLMIERVGSLEV